MCAVSAAAIAWSAATVKKEGFDVKKMVIAGTAGAAVLAAQAVNYAIPGTGSSGHVLGALILAAMIGASPAMLVMSAVIIIQCLAFADGGVLALGANIFNMAVIPCLFVYPLIFKPLTRNAMRPAGIIAVSMLSAVVALQLGAFGVVAATQLSGITTLPFAAFALAMQPIHLAIGIGEGLATAAVLCLVWALRPEIIRCAYSGIAIGSRTAVKPVAAAFAAVALITALVLPHYASDAPDGLEWSIEKATESAAVIDADNSAAGG